MQEVYWLNHEDTKAGRCTKIKCVMYQQLPAVESSLNNPTIQVSDTTGDAIKN